MLLSLNSFGLELYELTWAISPFACVETVFTIASIHAICKKLGHCHNI